MAGMAALAPYSVPVPEKGVEETAENGPMTLDVSRVEAQPLRKPKRKAKISRGI